MEKEIDKLTLIADKSKAKEEIKKEKERLKKYILSLPDAIQNINEGLLEMAAFNKVVSEYLEEYILEKTDDLWNDNIDDLEEIDKKKHKKKEKGLFD